MREPNTSRWIQFSLFNLLLVALLGVVMRYKIGFEFPFLNQKNLQHAHSHFAFSGWVSQMLMVFMIAIIRETGVRTSFRPYNLIVWGNLVCALGMLVAFSIQGYGGVSIFFSSASIVIAYYFAWVYWNDLRRMSGMPHRPWFYAALLFNILSTFGTFALVYMMVTKNIPQHPYLASVYWYLHFQYNGWFFFACMGIFLQQIASINIESGALKRIFWLFAVSCVPAYGLSILWAHIPTWIYGLVVLAAAFQVIAWLLLLKELYRQPFWQTLSTRLLPTIMGVFLLTAVSIKLCLQLGSVIPSVSKLAFGFRPIVIAYLHLVLLAIITMYLVAHSYLYGSLRNNRMVQAGIYVLMSGIFLNELILAIQGVASFGYTVIPGVNPALWIISMVILLGVLLMFIGNGRALRNT